MIRHLFRLVWNRRRANGLILVELMLCFLVLCGVLTFAGLYLDSWCRPLGFSYDNVWALDLVVPESDGLIGGSDKGPSWDRYLELERALGTMDGIVAVSPLPVNVPFGGSMMGYRNFVNGVFDFIYINEVRPSARDILEFEVIAGRWLEPGDEALDWKPVVITRAYALAMFGNDDPIGHPLPFRDENGAPKQPREGFEERRVVGVISDVRPRGEFSPTAFAQFSVLERNDDRPVPGNLLVRVQPGVTAAYEEKLLEAVRNYVPGWTVTISPLATAREAKIREVVLQILTGAIVAAFLIVMVGLGLVGVLWQSVSRRTQEWGLRRALGATATVVRYQVLGELLALTSVAAAIGTVAFVQLPLLEVFAEVPLHVYLLALVASLAVIYSFVILCGLYPSWLATRVNPAEALQHE